MQAELNSYFWLVHYRLYSIGRRLYMEVHAQAMLRPGRLYVHV